MEWKGDWSWKEIKCLKIKNDIFKFWKAQLHTHLHLSTWLILWIEFQKGITSLKCNFKIGRETLKKQDSNEYDYCSKTANLQLETPTWPKGSYWVQSTRNRPSWAPVSSFLILESAQPTGLCSRRVQTVKLNFILEVTSPQLNAAVRGDYRSKTNFHESTILRNANSLSLSQVCAARVGMESVVSRQMRVFYRFRRVGAPELGSTAWGLLSPVGFNNHLKGLLTTNTVPLFGAFSFLWFSKKIKVILTLSSFLNVTL